jgi:hypothetical protein
MSPSGLEAPRVGCRCKKRLWRAAFASILLFSCTTVHSPMTASNAPSTQVFKELHGIWQAADQPDYFIEIERNRLLIAYGGRERESMVIQNSYQGGLKVCRFGRDGSLSWRMDGQSLLLDDISLKETHRLRKLHHRPKALTPSRLLMPAPMPLSEERVIEIQRELSLRMQNDQTRLRAPGHLNALERAGPSWLETRSDLSPSLPSGQTDFEFAAIVTENTEYIRKILAEVGWIDVGRFGYSTSKAAFILVQHSWEAPLMSAVLPYLKQDVDAGRIEADTYALLFDRLQLSLGRRQRFGSQVATDETGALVVLPVEDPSKVDALRAGLGMIPLKEYFQVFGASEVKFSDACR